MNLQIPVLPPPPPVIPFKIDITVRYIVVRGNGDNKIFDSIYGGGTAWNVRGNYPEMDLNKTVLIPIDIVTALALGLVQVHELELPEHLKAFVNMIKP